MGGAIGEVLPSAVGVAVSPVPIIATILMLLSPEARRTSVGFLLGWVGGIVVAVVAFTLLGGLLADDGSGEPSTTVGVIKLVLGLLLIGLAARRWRGRPRGDAEPQLPAWMNAIDAMTPLRGVGLAFLLAAVNPKNLLLAASAGILVSQAATTGDQVAALVAFVVVAASTVAVPVIAYLAAAERMAAGLEALRAWLVHHNDAIMVTLLFVLGVSALGKGLGAL